jgi:D-glycero-D-manno-heptose 1,7-bisphosphate phosphatase
MKTKVEKLSKSSIIQCGDRHTLTWSRGIFIITLECSRDPPDILIKTLTEQSMQQHSGSNPARRAILLDRDGVINVKLPQDRYVCSPGEFEFVPGAIEALLLLRDLGFLLVVITNQRGIALGCHNEDDLSKVHEYMGEVLLNNGVALDAIYYCPHDSIDHCECRKPAPGMIFSACQDLELDLANSYMVGDSASDIEAGRKAGSMTVKIGTGPDCQADLIFPSLLDFAVFLKERGLGHSVTKNA